MTIRPEKSKHYNLTYFITFLAVETFAEHKFIPFNRKPYKMFYIGGFIMINLKRRTSYNYYLPSLIKHQ